MKNFWGLLKDFRSHILRAGLFIAMSALMLLYGSSEIENLWKVVLTNQPVARVAATRAFEPH